MKIVNSIDKITIGLLSLPKNSIIVELKEKDNIAIYARGIKEPILVKEWRCFVNSLGVPYATREDVVADLEVSMIGSAATSGDALESTQQLVLSQLEDIYTAVDELELSVDQIVVDTDQINLNTDQLETILTNIDNKLSLVDNATKINLPASLTEATILVTNSLRKEAVIHNASNGILYILCGTGVTTTNYSYKLNRQDYCIIDTYRGQINGIFTSNTGFAMITEKYY